jgi:hypothetical protein
MKRLLLILFIGISGLGFGQGDECFNAVHLGTLPVPEDCMFLPSPTAGFGATITQSGTTTGFTPGNP